MEDIKSIRNREAATGGLVLGVVLFITEFASYLAKGDQTVKTVISFVNVGLISYILYYFARRYADIRGNMGTSYGVAFGYILIVSLFGGVIYGTLYYILTNFIDPAFYEQLGRDAIINAKNVSNDEKELALKIFKESTSNPFIVIVSAIFGTTLGSAFVGLAVAAFAKRNEVIEIDDESASSEESN